MSTSITSSHPSANPASYSAAYGALLGAAVGDSCGSYLEFHPDPIIPQLVDTALTMPGGGVWRIAPGQLTDDTELALCLAHGLLEAATPLPDSTDVKYGGLPASCIARWYSRWMASRPFDCGSTCAASLGQARHLTAVDDTTHLPADTMTATAARVSLASKANGALMRLTPLPICYHRCTDEQIAAVAAVDAQLSHPNATCQLANSLYAIAISALIRQPHDRPAALQRAVDYLHYCRSHSTVDVQAIDEVEGWLTVARRAAGGSVQLDDVRQYAGYVKHAFTLAFYHLVSGSEYEAAIRHTLLAGGDTDTNAAIVGGLIGSAVGADGIPVQMAQAVLRCRVKRERPQWLYPSLIPDIVHGLYNKLA